MGSVVILWFCGFVPTRVGTRIRSSSMLSTESLPGPPVQLSQPSQPVSMLHHYGRAPDKEAAGWSSSTFREHSGATRMPRMPVPVNSNLKAKKTEKRYISVISDGAQRCDWPGCRAQRAQGTEAAWSLVLSVVSFSLSISNFTLLNFTLSARLTTTTMWRSMPLRSFQTLARMRAL